MQIEILDRARCLIEVIIELCQLIARHRARCIAQFSLGGNFVAAHLAIFGTGSLVAVEVVSAPPVPLRCDCGRVVRAVDNKDFYVAPP